MFVIIASFRYIGNTIPSNIQFIYCQIRVCLNECRVGVMLVLLLSHRSTLQFRKLQPKVPAVYVFIGDNKS